MNRTQLIAEQRPALIQTLARLTGDADAAGYMVDAAFDRYFANPGDPDKGSASYWILCESLAVAAGWNAPAADAHRQVIHTVDNSMAGQEWPDGEWQRRYEAGMRETFSQPRAITDGIDALFAASTDHAATWEKLDAIRRRAAEWQTVLEDSLVA